MTRRKNSSAFHVVKEILPSYGSAQANTVNLVVASVFLYLGITDVDSYFRKLRVLIAICAFACAIYGASIAGHTGFSLGALCGVIAPAVLVWLGVVLVFLTIYLAVWFSAMACVLYALWWLICAALGG